MTELHVLLKGKHLLTLADYEANDIEYLIKQASELKQKHKNGEKHAYLEGKTLAMIFEKSSTRTRVSFEVGMEQLGGNALYLNKQDLQMGRSETIADTAKVLSRFVDGMMIRANSHETVVELARHASVPVINGLTDLYHPCQVLADLLTIYEQKGYLKGNKLAYIGDGNNMAHSLMIGCAKVGIDCVVASPAQYEPHPEIVKQTEEIAARSGATVSIVHNPSEAVKDADFVYTDVWTSMGMEEEYEKRLIDFQNYQVTSELMGKAKPDAKFLHCLPAHRGEEVAAEVIDGKQSLVFDEAENRLHAQKALLVALLKDD